MEKSDFDIDEWTDDRTPEQIQADHKAFDEDENISQQYAQLSEQRKIEFHRRNDDALYFGVAAAKEKYALDSAREKLKVANTNSAKGDKWIFALLVFGAIVGFMLPERIDPVSVFFFLSILWTIHTYIFRDIAIPKIVSELDDHQRKYELICTRWRLVTGMRFGQREIEVEQAEAVGGLHEESEQHYRKIRRGILRKMIDLDNEI